MTLASLRWTFSWPVDSPSWTNSCVHCITQKADQTSSQMHALSASNSPLLHARRLRQKHV
ncbi:uncharacterized protein L969DRAFT_44859 [Mixia osmundae IAM 14324]|uniref:Uncharacterized protein n=1 Tax=Mixia osmundae (strain CBS 9802 / IAM 14324 / JCM 22182 / KY 12970) TaxID=764103 RepID=G7DTZ5_MIXOS|nr:uncharacterized protein L969DRAFT_44859 [Mixia osmundae IAM 14324]KEI41769.1 hypothetical protein L969DRAFT_44859 [Mixia osmundae IAM 14324]GAA94055.1 hypothetical protein E5Q_00702 [Mixia osmundae IAM 14324]